MATTSKSALRSDLVQGVVPRPKTRSRLATGRSRLHYATKTIPSSPNAGAGDVRNDPVER